MEIANEENTTEGKTRELENLRIETQNPNAKLKKRHR